jgi:[acyl-carrier-protein] S-malonyltransferase
VALFAAASDLYTPVVSAGHSFGEYCALTVAGAIPFDAALHLVNERGLAMQHAAELAPGGMTAILGLDPDPLRAVVAQARAESGGRVDLANFNAPGQIVISGDLEAVAVAARLATEAGAKRAVVLNVSGAWHSELMEPAKAEFAPFVAAAPIAIPQFEVISNVDAEPYRDVETIRRNLVTSVASEVRWYDVALEMVGRELDLVIELGASAVLTSLFKRVAGAPKSVHAGDASGIRKIAELLAAIPA